MNFLRSPSNEGHHPKRVGYRPKRHPRRGRADPPRAGPRTVRGRDGAPLAPRGLLGRRIARASQPRSRGLQPLGALLPRQRRTCEKRQRAPRGILCLSCESRRAMAEAFERAAVRTARSWGAWVRRRTHTTADELVDESQPSTIPPGARRGRSGHAHPSSSCLLYTSPSPRD